MTEKSRLPQNNLKEKADDVICIIAYGNNTVSILKTNHHLTFKL